MSFSMILLETVSKFPNYQPSDMIADTLVSIGTVFVGLICIVIMCKIVGGLCKVFIKPVKKEDIALQNSVTELDTNHSEVVAAISCAIAEDMGSDVEALRIHSIKKI